MTEKFGFVSFHLQEERAERVRMIETHVGWGEPMLEVQEENIATILTTTGVMVIKDLRVKMVVTAYIPSPTQLLSVFMKAGKTSIPNEFFTTTRNAYRILNGLGM